jgi:hypothetical protein
MLLAWSLLAVALGLHIVQLLEVFGFVEPGPRKRAHLAPLAGALLTALVMAAPWLGHLPEQILALLPLVVVPATAVALVAAARVGLDVAGRPHLVCLVETLGLGGAALVVLPIAVLIPEPAPWLADAAGPAVVAAAVLVASAGGTAFTLAAIGPLRHALGTACAAPGQAPQASPQLRLGRLIGVLERLLLLIFVLDRSFAAVAFVLTAKSVTRFKKLEDKDFAEYYLVGTLASTLWAIAVGLLAGWLHARLIGG